MRFDSGRRERRSGFGDRQRGAALIVALLVVTLVVLMAVTVSSDFLLLFRRVENQLHGDQATGWLVGAESLARAALLADLQDARGSALDSKAEPWGAQIALPTDTGWIRSELIDMQARLNVNGLAGTPGDSAGAGYTPAQERMVRLLRALPLEQPLSLEAAQALTEAITDWIDPDDLPTGLGGAESDWYEGAAPPGRPANRPVASVSELMWVKGMTAEIYRQLAPLLTAWPQQGGEFNINVAIDPTRIDDHDANRPARLLLASLNARGNLEPLPAEAVDRLVAELALAGGFADLQSFQAAIGGLEVDLTGLGVRSDYFLLTSSTEHLGRQFHLQSLLFRDASEGAVKVVARTTGEF